MAQRASLELVLDCGDPQQLEEFWCAALGYRSLYSSAPLVVLVPNDDTNGSPLLLQQVPEPKLGKNRMHLDLITEFLEPEVGRLISLGATRAHEGVQRLGSVQWITMLDPVGNEFCVSTGVEW